MEQNMHNYTSYHQFHSILIKIQSKVNENSIFIGSNYIFDYIL